VTYYYISAAAVAAVVALGAATRIYGRLQIQLAKE
jgi:hypothetical protein